MSWWNPVNWIEDAEDVAEDLADATVTVATSVADELVDVGNTLVSTGNTLYNDIADGAVATFNTATGGVIYAVDWTETETATVAKYALSTSGDIAHFSVDLYGKTKSFAEDAWKTISSFLMTSPPALGPETTMARDFIKSVLLNYVAGSESAAESIVSFWERDARKKGYTMAMVFDAGIQIISISSDVISGVYVDSNGKWGVLADIYVTATIIPALSISFTMDLYMVFGPTSKYSKEYYFIGGTFDVEGFIIGGDILLSSGFDFAGFKTSIGVGVSYDLFADGGSSSAKSASKSSKSVGASPTLPGLDIYSVNLLSEQGSTYDVACQVASDSSNETSITANASGAMTLKSSSILASDQVGGSGGSSFSDDVTNVERIQSIKLSGGSQVDFISITYVLHDGSTVVKTHGGSGGTSLTLPLSDDEYITKVTGRSGSMLDQVCFTTSYGRSIKAGGSGGSAFTIDPKPNRPILGVFGRSGSLIDALGVYYRSGKPFTLQSRQSSLYLDVTGQMSAKDGASAVQQRSTGGPHQHWLLSPGPAEGEYYIVNDHTGLYLEVSGTAAGASIVENTASGAANQVWELTQVAPYSLIKNKGTGLYMDVLGGSTEAGAQVVAWTLNSGANQQWRLASAPTKVYAFSSGGFAGSFQAFGPGRYDMSKLTIGNDAIRSIRVPDGWRVTLYQDALFSGATQTLTRDASELGTMSGAVSGIYVELPPWGATITPGYDNSGTSMVLMPGRYSSLSGIGFKDNSVSSVTVPPGWRVTLFKDEDFGGTATALTSSTSNLNSLGVNDTTSSIVVESDPLGQVVLYLNKRYEGTSQVLGPGRYDVSTLKASGGVGDNLVSSLKVPINWTVILYEKSGYSGSSKTITADCSDVGDFNDKTSSLVIIPG
jgi:hypothetical protein